MDIQLLLNGQTVSLSEGFGALLVSFGITYALKFSRDDAWCNAHPYMAIPCKLLRGIIPDSHLALVDVIKLLTGQKLGDDKR